MMTTILTILSISVVLMLVFALTVKAYNQEKHIRFLNTEINLVRQFARSISNDLGEKADAFLNFRRDVNGRFFSIDTAASRIYSRLSQIERRAVELNELRDTSADAELQLEELKEKTDAIVDIMAYLTRLFKE